MLFLERQKSARRALVNKNSTLRHSVNQFGSGIRSDQERSACLGAFGHFGDVRMHALVLCVGHSQINNRMLGCSNA